MPVISTNIAANSAVRYLNMNSASETSSLSKLASGSRITEASDDAAGLAISTRLSSDITSLEQASTNTSHAVAILQTADGGAASISDILQRMKSLATEAASGTVGSSERTYINQEFSALSSEIDGTATSTTYDGSSLLAAGASGTVDYTGSGGVAVIVGQSASDTISIQLSKLDTTTLGINSLDVSTQSGATSALTALDTAIDSVSSARANIGAQESRFQFRSATIATSTQNLQSANSAIADVDVASEEAKLASEQVKTQAAVAAASQANQMTQALLKLMQ